MAHLGTGAEDNILSSVNILYQLGGASNCDNILKDYLLYFADTMVRTYKSCGLTGYEWWDEDLCKLRDQLNGECNVSTTQCSQCCHRRLDEMEISNYGNVLLRSRSLAQCGSVNCANCCSRKLRQANDEGEVDGFGERILRNATDEGKSTEQIGKEQSEEEIQFALWDSWIKNRDGRSLASQGPKRATPYDLFFLTGDQVSTFPKFQPSFLMSNIESDGVSFAC